MLDKMASSLMLTSPRLHFYVQFKKLALIWLLSTNVLKVVGADSGTSNVYADHVVSPSVQVQQSSTFPTHMTASDLTEWRKEELQGDFLPQMKSILMKVTGFQDVMVDSIFLGNNSLSINWTLHIDQEHPAFKNKTKEEMLQILIQDLNKVKPFYKDIRIDTSPHPATISPDDVSATWIGVGVGVGLAVLILLAVLIVLGVKLCRRQGARPLVLKDSQDDEKGSGEGSVRSTQLDPSPYTYDVLMFQGASPLGSFSQCSDRIYQLPNFN